MCAAKFPLLICRPIAAQFLQDDVIALFELEGTVDGIRVASEKHYKLAPPEDISDADLKEYATRLVLLC